LIVKASPHEVTFIRMSCQYRRGVRLFHVAGWILCSHQRAHDAVWRRDVHYSAFRGSGIFRNLYFESAIL